MLASNTCLVYENTIYYLIIIIYYFYVKKRYFKFRIIISLFLDDFNTF